MAENDPSILDRMRTRILRGLQAGVLQTGDRLPSARELESDFGADHRAMLAMYRELEREGLVEIRPRSGIYVARLPGGTDGVPPLPADWMIDFFVDGIARQLPLPELHEWMRRSVETLRLRVVAVAATADQRDGLCRELRDDYGVEASALDPDALDQNGASPIEMRSADLVVTTEGVASTVVRIAANAGKPSIVITVRPDLLTDEWQLLLRRPVYVIAESPAFVERMMSYFAQSSPEAAQNIRPLVTGRDDLSVIPDGAPTYVTQRARELLRGTPIPGRILPAARILSTVSSRELVSFIVRANLAALARTARQGEIDPPRPTRRRPGS